MEFSKSLEVNETSIPGLLILDLPVHGDSRGWFKENWQREKMLSLGLPDFSPIQNNISFNDEIGTTRGIHAEPWDKYISVATGKIFGAWVDLREGEGFGEVVTAEIDPSRAVFVPRGVGNSYQTLESNTAYTYLVNDHWSATTEYSFLNLGDETSAIKWPIPLEEALLSDKDKVHPPLSEVSPVSPKQILVLGANGQLGKALRKEFPDAIFASRQDIDITDPEALESINWKDISAVINASAYTKVDLAETEEGRQQAWSINVRAVSDLTRICSQNNLLLVHISSDYVFDGTNEGEYSENDFLSPLGVYGQTKAAGDAIVSSLPSHYILRTSWVIGEGANFVRTMGELAEKGKNPSVVDDQVGRLTFTKDLALAIQHLIEVNAPYGTYNITNSGRPASWADVARKVFDLTGHDANRVTGISTTEYFEGKTGISPRPLNSLLSLGKIYETGFRPESWESRLAEYLLG